MSLTLITALTTLRVAIGATGVIYSVFTNNDEAGNFKSSDVPTAIFGQAIGGVFYDWLKQGASIGYDRLTAKLDALDPDALNHDLQRAARKSVLLATFMACQGCLADLKSERGTILHRLKNVAWKDEDINWLIVVAGELKNEIDNLDKAAFDDKLHHSELFNIFDKDNIANSETAQKEYADKLREQTLKDIKDNYYSKFGGMKTVELSENGLKLLSEAMKNGWSKIEEDKNSIVQLRLTENGQNVKDYDWFKLVCLIFNEEFKVNEQLEAAIEKQTTLEQTAILKELQQKLSYFGSIQNYTDIGRQLDDFREENYLFHQITHDKINELKEIILGQLRRTNPSVPVHNLPPLDERVYGREFEKVKVVEALKSGNKKFSLVVAPSGFGKTRLLAKVLQDYTDGRTIYQKAANEVDRLMLIDCRLVQNLSDITRELNTVLGTNLIFENRLRNYNEAWLKLVFEMIAGKTWLFLDNFEAWLTDGYQILNAELRAFLNVLFVENHGFRGVVLSQSLPEQGILNNLNILNDVGTKISEGLDKDSAIQYLRDNADAGNGLDTAPEQLLVRFLEEVSYIPQALNSLTGYLKSISGYTFAEFMDKQNGFWSQFDEHEQNETDVDNGTRRTKALIKQQILRQSSDVQKLMQILSFFTRSVPREALELFFDSKPIAAQSISRLTSHNLATLTTGIRGTKYYELHNYFREQSRKWLKKFEDIPTELLLSLSDNILLKGNEAYTLNFLNRAFSLYELSEQIAHYVSIIAGQEIFKNFLANSIIGKGIILDELGRLEDAIKEYENAIKIFEDLVNTQKRSELANYLARTYMNKGVALWNIGRLYDSINELDKAIKIREDLVNTQDQSELAHSLAMTYMNKGIVLSDLLKLNEAIEEIKKATKVLEDLVNIQNQKQLSNDLAMIYMNLGFTLEKAGGLDDGIQEYDKAIKIYEDLINVQNRSELVNALATTYMNKGNAYCSLNKLESAVQEYNKSEKIRLLCLERRELQVLPEFVKNIGNRVTALIEMKNWREVAVDVYKAVYKAENYLVRVKISEHFIALIKKYQKAIFQSVMELSPEIRQEIYNYLPEKRDEIIAMIESSGD